MPTGAIFINKEWLDANKDVLIKNYDQIVNKPEDKGTHLMIMLDNMVQEDFKVNNETMTIRASELDKNDEKKVLAYISLDYDMEPTVQHKISEWMVNRFAKLTAAAKLLLQHEPES